MKKSLGVCFLFLVVLFAIVCVDWSPMDTTGVRVRRAVTAPDKSYNGQDLLVDEKMEELRAWITKSIVYDGEWIRANLPDTNEEYYDMCISLRYFSDSAEEGTQGWQTPSVTHRRGGGDCEDLVTYQLALALALEPDVRLGFLVLYPEVVVPEKKQGHITMAIQRLSDGEVFVWDLAFMSLRDSPVSLEYYMWKMSTNSDMKYFRVWWLLESDNANQPPMMFVPTVVGLGQEIKEEEKYPMRGSHIYLVQFDTICVKYKGEWVTHLYFDRDPTLDIYRDGGFLKIMFSPDDIWLVPQHRILYIRKVKEPVSDEERLPFGIL